MLQNPGDSLNLSAEGADLHLRQEAGSEGAGRRRGKAV